MSEQEDFERPKLEPKGKSYRLAEDWHTDCKHVLPSTILIPKGFVTDGASIPRMLWWLCGSPMDTPRIFAAIVHDYMYTFGGKVECHNPDGSADMIFFDRADADEIYRDYQIAMGISKIKAYTEYYALRACGWSHWSDDD